MDDGALLSRRRHRLVLDELHRVISILRRLGLRVWHLARRELQSGYARRPAPLLESSPPRRFALCGALGPDCGKEDSKDGDIAVDSDYDEPAQEICVAEDDDDFGYVHDDGEDKVGDEYVE